VSVQPPPIHVLIVDDDPYILNLLKSFLEQKGMKITTAANAEDAIALSNLDEIHIALLDLRLPGVKDGQALCRDLNIKYPDMAKILMSGNADLENAVAALSEQVSSFVTKPFSSLREIGLLIERAVESKQLEIQNRVLTTALQANNIELAERVNARLSETQHYQRILSYLFQASSQIGRIERTETLLDYLCQSVVEAGAFRRAAVVLADEKFRVQHVGIFQEGGVHDSLRNALKHMLGKPLRPFEFERSEEEIGAAILIKPDRQESSVKQDDNQNSVAGNLLILPVMRGEDSIMGYLSLEAPLNGTRPSQDIVQLMEVLLTHGALHMEAQELREELKKRAYEMELRVHERTRELRLSEERYSRLVNSTTDIVYIADDQDRIVFLNEAFARTLGYIRENYIGRSIQRMLEELNTDNPINPKALLELSSHQEDHTILHVEVLTRQGDKRTLEINRTIIRQGGTLKGTQGIIRDITEHRILLQQLVSSERLAATGRLAAGIAHEINNPLQAMSSQLSTIEKKVAAGENADSNFEMLQEGIERIRHIVRSMLDLHRGPSMTQMPANLNDIAEKVLAVLGQEMRQKNIELHTVLDPDLPQIIGSPQELQQVLLNLILNAIDAMPSGGILNLTSRTLEKSVEISVQDNGVGIAGEHLPQIFEPFFTFKPSGSGTGLGLYLCKNIMEMHEGEISVVSERGKGATFTLSIPR
jgi:PAS domain S-box-containing protein